MATFKALSRGSQLVLVAGPLLFISLFFTWQNRPVDYGRSGVATMPLDGWDAWGLLIAFLTIATVTIVVLDEFTEVEMSEDVPWATVTLALGVGVLAAAVVKSLTDAGSTWESYAFVALAGAVAVGTYLDWVALRRAAKRPMLTRKRRGISSAA
jgi:hypothetical protein